MEENQWLPFIRNEDLYREIDKVIKIAAKASTDAEEKLYSNVIDPFSALFDASCQGITLSEWIKKEKSRQIQKTLQNALGDFHQEILGAITGWESLGKGSVTDVKNDTRKIIAEIKNKFNTTKGNHRIAIYDDLKNLLAGDFLGYTAYYVEVIPKNRRAYDKPFVPSDNRKEGKRRPKNSRIRIIDGKSFYGMATGDPEALKKIYLLLPRIVGDILGRTIEGNDKFIELFERAY